MGILKLSDFSGTLLSISCSVNAGPTTVTLGTWPPTTSRPMNRELLLRPCLCDI